MCLIFNFNFFDFNFVIFDLLLSFNTSIKLLQIFHKIHYVSDDIFTENKLVIMILIYCLLLLTIWFFQVVSQSTCCVQMKIRKE